MRDRKRCEVYGGWGLVKLRGIQPTGTTRTSTPHHAHHGTVPTAHSCERNVPWRTAVIFAHNKLNIYSWVASYPNARPIEVQITVRRFGTIYNVCFQTCLNFTPPDHNGCFSFFGIWNIPWNIPRNTPWNIQWNMKISKMEYSKKNRKQAK